MAHPSGMPEVPDDVRAKNASKSYRIIFGVMVFVRVVTGCIAFAIYKLGNKTLYDANISNVATLQRQWLYAAAGVISLLVFWLNMWPMVSKSQIMLRDSGNLRANMTILRVSVEEDAPELPYVVMEERGDIGRYNRANRSLFHFNENIAGTILNIVLVGMVFPFPAFVLAIILAIGRILHQVGYANGGYGKHAPGFITSMLASTTIEMLAWTVVVVSFSRNAS
eukprot:CAMPEP_0171104050 /NCGR_PEP_ID=MMETSP0766_2-20121228/59908_1 /TAXON_ID=439317 /ORGANISM="Gambierdiscus australes, Strain CAWD 149" /LENGTH=222 /DNA_ID=CAMNT_0011564599 /DNA_START=72 /DNA_END=740 /DNA_ORIENTATION=+